MKLAVIVAMALAAFAAADSASARGKQVSIGKGSIALPKKTVSPTVGRPASKGPTTSGIIMSDGRICNPRWGC
jgi:hypothetical protein